MKKLLSVMVAVCFLSMTAGAVYGQETPKKDASKKSKKKSGKKKEETPKKEGGK